MAEHAQRRRWYFRWWAWVLGALLLVTVAFVIALQPLARYATRRALASVPGYVGSFEDAHVSIIPLLQYEVTKLKLEPSDRSRPTLYAEDMVASLDWKWLLRRKNPRRGLGVQGESRPPRGQGEGGHRHHPRPLQHHHSPRAGSAAPGAGPPLGVHLRLSQREGREGQGAAGCRGAEHVPKLWIHDVEATIENLATRPELAEGRPPSP
jgi:hypothetical protein